jgi:hypothetical protein
LVFKLAFSELKGNDMEEKIFEYSNCTVTVHRQQSNSAKLHKATEKFLREVIKNKKCK